MDYNYLKQIQKTERNSSKLSPLPETYYQQCSKYFSELKEQTSSLNDVRIYRNTFNCYTEIFERRLEKITRNAYFKVVSTYKLDEFPNNDDIIEPPSNLLKEELELYEELVEMYMEMYKKITYYNLNEE